MGKNTVTTKRSGCMALVYINDVAIGRVVGEGGKMVRFCPFNDFALNHEQLYNLSRLLKRIGRGEE